MPLLEATITTAIALPIAKFLLKQAFGDTITSVVGESLLDMISSRITDSKEQREVEERFKRMAREVASSLWPIFEHESTQVPHNELEAAAHELATTIGNTVNTRLIIDLNLNAGKLENVLKRTNSQGVSLLGEVGRSLYLRALKELAPQLVAISPKLQDFQEKTTAQILTQLDDLDSRLSAILQAPAIQEARYESRYLAAVQKTLDEMELFGAELRPGQDRHGFLKVAYISLNLNEDGVNIGAERLLDENTGEAGRLLIIGDAGSGKSTLTRWLSIGACHSLLSTTGERNEYRSMESENQRSDENLDTWRKRIPFLVRLRDYANGKLPKPEEIPAKLETELGDVPAGWVQKVLLEGRGLIIFDGIDEVPEAYRKTLRKSMQGYFQEYEKTPFLLSARPASVADWDEWIKQHNFKQAQINPMSPTERTQLIRQWHESIKRLKQGQNVSDAEIKEIEEAGKNLIEKLPNEPGLARLAEFPLVCAIICALHYWKKQRLPKGYWQLCNALCEMLIHERDQEALEMLVHFPEPYKSLDTDHKRQIARDIALKMVEIQFASSLDIGVAIDAVENTIINMGRNPREAEGIVRFMGERSGILRVPTLERIEFIHNTFKEFLIAEALIEDPDLRKLIAQVNEPDWKGVVVAAASCKKQHVAQKLISALLESGNWHSELLALRCRNIALYPGTPDPRFDLIETRLFPPSDREKAQAISDLGNLEVDRLVYYDTLSHEQANACVIALGYINTDNAREAAKGYVDDERVTDELVRVINPLLIPKVLAKVSQKEEIKENWRLQITDATPLENMTHLETLNLRGTSISDFTFLQRLSKLQRLDLMSTSISDLTPLRSLTQLQILDLEETLINDLTLLQELVGLESLIISDTTIRDLTPLQSLIRLQRLFLSHTSVSDLTPLQGLFGLESLIISDTRIRDLTPLRSLTKLYYLSLYETPVSDLTPIQGLFSLQTLNLTSTSITDLRPLRGLTQLSELRLGHTLISDISPLRGLTKLKQLVLSSTPISDLTPLRGLTQLHTIDLMNTSISDLTPLAGLSNLEKIDLRFTPVRDLTPLKALTQLKNIELYVDTDNRRDITGIEELEEKITWN